MQNIHSIQYTVLTHTHADSHLTLYGWYVYTLRRSHTIVVVVYMIGRLLDCLAMPS